MGNLMMPWGGVRRELWAIYCTSYQPIPKKGRGQEEVELKIIQ
ncbi:MAG: hypothetical protein V7K38_26365 [Nostoc sp.]